MMILEIGEEIGMIIIIIFQIPQDSIKNNFASIVYNINRNEKMIKLKEYNELLVYFRPPLLPY